MDNFKVLFCLFGGRKFRPSPVGTNSTCSIARPVIHGKTQSDKNPKDSNVSPFRFTSLQPRHSVRLNIRHLVLMLVALLVPIYLVGCGGGSSVSSQLTPPSSTSSGSGTTGTTGTGTTGTGSTGTTGTTGTGGTGSTGSTGTGTTGTGGTGSTGTTGTGTTGTGGTGSTGTGGSEGTVIANIQTTSGKWSSFGQVGPNYVDCSPSPCEGITWSMKPNITLPSLSNNATQFSLGGTTPYGDVLFTAALIGQSAPQIQDADHTLLPTLHNFTYDADFYVSNPAITQALEFDISFWMGGTAGMTFGTQCNYLGDKDWDVYDNSHRKWMSAGVPCNFVTGWNHVTIQVQRQSDNSALYKSITLNGTLYTLNQSYPSVLDHPSWWGINLNYQIDGNSKQSANVTYIDNLNFTYW